MGSKPEPENVAHLLGCLPSMQEALNSIPRATQTGRDPGRGGRQFRSSRSSSVSQLVWATLTFGL